MLGFLTFGGRKVQMALTPEASISPSQLHGDEVNALRNHDLPEGVEVALAAYTVAWSRSLRSGKTSLSRCSGRLLLNVVERAPPIGED